MLWSFQFSIFITFITCNITDLPTDVTLTIYNWDHPPYITKGENLASAVSNIREVHIKGMFQEVLSQLVETCFITKSIRAVLLNNQNDIYVFNWRSRALSVPSQIEVFMPLWAHKQDSIMEVLDAFNVPYDFRIITESPGSIHFYRRPQLQVGSDLATVIVQGWPMLVFIMLGAAYSGIIIWLLDRLWNEQNFPKPFLKGFWEGFWWAFVTMTTVGYALFHNLYSAADPRGGCREVKYGDTTPRSIQARVFGLVWIVVGVTILSVFTATVTTVLTQETLGNENRLQGALVAVKNGTDEVSTAVQLGAEPVVLNSLPGLLENISTGGVQASLMEQYSFAAIESILDHESFLIEKMVPNPVDFGILFVGNLSEMHRSCLSEKLASLKPEMLTKLLQYIHPLSTHTTSASEKAQRLFRPRTIRYMWYAVAAWAAVFLAFVIWEFAYWRPKHKKRQAAKKQTNQTQPKTDDHPVSKADFSPRFRGSLYRPASAPCLSSASPAYETCQSHRSVRSQARKLQNGFIKPNQPHARFYANRGFVSDGDSEGSAGLQRSNLEDLIKSQTAELRQLETEFLSYKAQWQTKVKQTKIKHQNEQRNYLYKLQEQSRNMPLNDVNAPRSAQLSRRNHHQGRELGRTNALSPDQRTDDISLNITVSSD